MHPRFENLLTPNASHLNLNNKQASILGEINKAALWWDWSVLFAESQPRPACCNMITELCAGKETSLFTPHESNFYINATKTSLIVGGKCVRDRSEVTE